MERPSALGVALARESQPAAPKLDERPLREVTLRGILRHDNLAFLLVAFGSVMLAFALAVWITGATPGGRGRPSRPVSPEEARAGLVAAGLLMASLCTLAGLRAWWIHRLFQIGERVQAGVTEVSHAKGHSRLALEYRHGGTSCTLRRSIRRSARARSLAPGDSVAILVDPARPRRLVLAELFDR